MPDPPAIVVDKLEEAARENTEAAAWVIRLDNFYQKQDIVAGK